MLGSSRRVRALVLLIATLLPATLAPAPGAAAPPAGGPADSIPSDTLAAPPESTGARGALVDSTALHRASATLTAEGAATPETLVTAPAASVPVFLGGKEIFRVRSARDGLAPAPRAAAIRARLTGAVADVRVPADSVRLLATPEGVEVRIGRHFLWLITPADAEGMSPADLAARMAELPDLVRGGIEKERAGRRPLGILVSALIALGVTVLALLLVRLLVAGARRWRAWLGGFLPRHLCGIRVRSFEVLSQGQVVGAVGGVLARLDVLVGLVLLYAYLTMEFSLFPWTQGWSWQLLHFAGVKAAEVMRSIGSALPGLFMIAVIALVFRWLTQLADRFFDAIEAGTHLWGSFHPELARPSKRLVRILLWIAAVIIAFPYIPGAQSKAFQGISLFLGVLVSLGSTGIVGNVLAGLVLTYSRSFRLGERVGIGDQVGDVVNLGFFATKLRTIRNEEVTLPNGQVAASAIVNYTRLARGPGLILHTEVTIGYDAEWRKVHELLAAAALRVEGIEKEPAPRVFQRSLGDSYVSYELTCVTRESHAQLRLYSDLHAEIQDAFNRAGVEIVSPAYHAVRDANAPVLPDEPKGPRPPAGGFRVRST